MKSYRLSELARALGGEIEGPTDILIDRVATLEGADGSSIAFFAQDRFAGALRDTRAGAVIVAEAHRNATGVPRIICANPYAYFAKVSALLHPPAASVAGVHPSAVIDASAVLGVNVCVGPHAVIEARARIADGAIVGANCVIGTDVSIGADARLWPGVVVYHGCRIGARSVLHAGVVVGADGFGNAWDEDHWRKVPQLGRAIIGEDVEVGANTTIDRGAMADTVVEDGVRLDNLIMVAHNVRIGAHTAIAACTGIAGSTSIGRYCRIGGAVGIAGHLTIADCVEIAGKTLITKSITVAGSYSGGYPFEETRQWRRNAIQIRHLDAMAKQIKLLEKRLAALEKNAS